MSRSISLSSLVITLITCGISSHANGEDPYAPRTARKPLISIGGPYGVVIGGGHGVRFGGPMGAQFGGGVGARFGGDYGAQFGGGEGVRIGPRYYRHTPVDAGPQPVDQPTIAAPSMRETMIHLSTSAGEAVKFRLGDQEIELNPGDTVAIPSDGAGVATQLPGPNGRLGRRQMLPPGTYLLRDSGRGWSVVRGELPAQAMPSENAPAEAGDAPAALQLNTPDAEELPPPAARSRLRRPASSERGY